MNQNRRKFHRIDSTDAQCVVKVGIEESTGIVIDESIEGFRIGDLNLMMLNSDQKITVEYNDDIVCGRCRSVARDQNGRFEIGVFRENNVYQGHCKSILINSFMRIHENNIVCVPFALVDHDRVRIRLMDGKEFIVDRSRINQLTREERNEELQRNENLQDIIHVYSMMKSPVKLTDIEQVLIQEFGPPNRPLHAAADSKAY